MGVSVKHIPRYVKELRDRRLWTFVHRIMPRLQVDNSLTYDGTPCWLWIGPLTKRGYARIEYEENGTRRKWQLHRWVYETFIGPIGGGLQPDHLCRQRACQNPNHLEPVTGRENAMRGVSPLAQNARKTHCKNGHELVLPNIYANRLPIRVCRVCAVERATKWNEAHNYIHQAAHRTKEAL